MWEEIRCPACISLGAKKTSINVADGSKMKEVFFEFAFPTLALEKKAISDTSRREISRKSSMALMTCSDTLYLLKLDWLLLVSTFCYNLTALYITRATV